MLTSSRDNWERLVAAVVKREEIWQLCHQPSISTITSDDLSSSFSGSSLDPFSVPPSPLPSKNLSNSQVTNDASSRSITRKLFSALYPRRKSKDHDLVDIPAEYPEVFLGQLERFSLRQLQVATDEFNNKNIMGRERPPDVPPLDWRTRKRIALGSARGLSYLHEHYPKMKASNILLDEEYEAVVGDFSLAKLMDHNDTHVTAVVRDTLGHITPEYISTGKTSEKSDVYWYGFTLLELITGQKPFDLHRIAYDDNLMLLDWVKGLLKEKKLATLVDPDLLNNYVEEEVEQLLQVALLCTQASALGRPKMSEVVRLLEGDGFAEK